MRSISITSSDSETCPAAALVQPPTSAASIGAPSLGRMPMVRAITGWLESGCASLVVGRKAPSAVRTRDQNGSARFLSITVSIISAPVLGFAGLVHADINSQDG